MVLDELKSLLKENGIVGAGGAGFPTYAKLSYDVNTVILNGAECEPLFRVDRNLLKEEAYKILKGLDIIVEILGAKEGIVAFKEHYKGANVAVDKEIYKFNKLRKFLLKDGYPAGDEVVLVYEAINKIVPQGGIPLNVGVMVVNVETVLNVYKAVIENTPVTHKYLTVGGAVNEPKTICAPIGIKFKELLKEVSGTTIEDFKVLIGGPMTGRFGSLNDTVTKTTKGIFIIPKDNPIVANREIKLSVELKRAMGVCSQCRMCTDLCPRYNLGHKIEPHKIMNSLAFGLNYNTDVFINAFGCSGCNLCSSYSCHQGLNPKAIIDELKVRFKKNGIKPIKINDVKVKRDREYRRVPVKRVLSRLSLSKFDKEAEIFEFSGEIKKLKINLLQSIGKAPYPVVKVNETVKKNQVIAKIDDSLGVYLHSPINGRVKSISNEFIEINMEV